MTELSSIQTHTIIGIRLTESGAESQDIVTSAPGEDVAAICDATLQLDDIAKVRVITTTSTDYTA